MFAWLNKGFHSLYVALRSRFTLVENFLQHNGESTSTY